jgi:hypothetical protein
MGRSIKSAVCLGLLATLMALPVVADNHTWEYQVVILQGITAGGAIEKLAKGVSLDTRKTETLNKLASEGWEVVAVVGAPVSDHTVYIRRKVGR